MNEQQKQESSIVRNWYWVVLINCFFIGVMVQFFFMSYPVWFFNSYRSVSLTHEMNYAVWWSGIYLFLAGVIFSKVGSLVQERGRGRWVWYVISAVLIALCIDEVGSLHESVAAMFGWYGLLPFAIVIGGVFSWALLILLTNKPTRLVAILILLGFSTFLSVVALEALEHDLSFQNGFWRRVRQVVEESAELIGVGLFVLAGLVAMKSVGANDRRFLNATSIISRILNFPFLIFLLFVGHCIFLSVLIIPNFTFFPEGNPGVLFPLLVFFCLGVISWQFSVKSGLRWFWRLLSVCFVTTSAMQMYNLNVMFNHVTGFDLNFAVDPPISWLVTLVPFLAISGHAVRQYNFPIRMCGIYMLVFGLIYLALYPDLRFDQRGESLYFLFSAAIAYACFLVLVYIREKQESSFL